MASINYATKEISVKVVYYGPGLSGKTTNLQVIHMKVPPENRSDMVSLATETDRTLFFDFLPLDLGTIKGFSTKFQLYTVPGQVYYNATRKLVLRGVDGIVFVADSNREKVQENIESYRNLEENLAEYGYQKENIAMVMQYNKRDLPNAISVEELDRLVNKDHLPTNQAVANKGQGVFETLKIIGKMVIDKLNKKYSRPTRPIQPLRPPSMPPAAEPAQPPRQAAPPRTFAPPQPRPAPFERETVPMPAFQRTPPPPQPPPPPQQRVVPQDPFLDSFEPAPPKKPATGPGGIEIQTVKGLETKPMSFDFEAAPPKAPPQRQAQAPGFQKPAPEFGTFTPPAAQQPFAQYAQYPPPPPQAQPQQNFGTWPQQPQQPQQYAPFAGQSFPPQPQQPMGQPQIPTFEVQRATPPPPSPQREPYRPQAQQPAQADDDTGADGTQFFTSVNLDRAKKGKKPVNPRIKPQGGFFSRLFKR
jgi:signal recognition particle receptor subunit beta